MTAEPLRFQGFFFPSSEKEIHLWRAEQGVGGGGGLDLGLWAPDGGRAHFSRLQPPVCGTQPAGGPLSPPLPAPLWSRPVRPGSQASGAPSSSCSPTLRPRPPGADRPSAPRSAGSAAAGHEWSTACPWCHTDGPRGPPQENGSSLFGVLVCLSSYCCNISVPKTPNFHHFSESSSVLHIRIIGPPLPSATSRTSSVS